MSKVIVGMSGGVDSAVTAYLLKEAGHDVIGVTLRTWVASDGTESRCCEIDDARKVAWKLDIPYHVFNCISDFQQHVIDPFIAAYVSGQTPNPCVVCNRLVKWDRLMHTARILGADRVATGHYASVVQLENGRYSVKKAIHAEKDQTYMLYRLSQEQLAATLMPLGAYTKSDVRSIAEQIGLHVAQKDDSQEICFVPDGDYAGFIEANAEAPIPGEGFFVDEAGKWLGTHKGIIHYTIGQRKGLGLAIGHPVYVKRIDPETNEVVIADDAALFSDGIVCGDVNFLSIPGLSEGEAMRCTAKIRYHHTPQEAVIEAIDGGRVRVSFAEPVHAAAPGQSAVFYDAEDRVIGGGIIEASA